jgi:hypothetical protein
MRAFPQLFAALASGEHERFYDAATLFGDGADESTLQSVRAWLEALPTAGLPRVPLTTKAMSREVSKHVHYTLLVLYTVQAICYMGLLMLIHSLRYRLLLAVMSSSSKCNWCSYMSIQLVIGSCCRQLCRCCELASASNCCRCTAQ